MTQEYKVFLPYRKFDEEIAFHWLCYNRSEKKFKGSFSYVETSNKRGSDIFFDEKEDMEHFILMWGEYL